MYARRFYRQSPPPGYGGVAFSPAPTSAPSQASATSPNTPPAGTPTGGESRFTAANPSAGAKRENPFPASDAADRGSPSSSGQTDPSLSDAKAALSKPDTSVGPAFSKSDAASVQTLRAVLGALGALLGPAKVPSSLAGSGSPQRDGAAGEEPAPETAAARNTPNGGRDALQTDRSAFRPTEENPHRLHPAFEKGAGPNPNRNPPTDPPNRPNLSPRSLRPASEGVSFPSDKPARPSSSPSADSTRASVNRESRKNTSAYGPAAAFRPVREEPNGLMADYIKRQEAVAAASFAPPDAEESSFAAKGLEASDFGKNTALPDNSRFPAPDSFGGMNIGPDSSGPELFGLPQTGPSEDSGPSDSRFGKAPSEKGGLSFLKNLIHTRFSLEDLLIMGIALLLASGQADDEVLLLFGLLLVLMGK